MDVYLECEIKCLAEQRELMIAELAEIGFEGFMEGEEGFSAYIKSSDFVPADLEELLAAYPLAEVSIKEIAPQNWNELWEQGYQPIIIADKVCIRAPFHTLEKEYNYDLVIQPKNTFGTGHHETTQLVVELMLHENFNNKTVFDYGCGTGVLGLMALKLGAKQVSGNDIDKWCVDNIAENKELNKLDHFTFINGDLSMIIDVAPVDIILANINKNILLSSFNQLSKLIKPDGLLFISGFYETDLEDLKQGAIKFGFSYTYHLTNNSWCAATFKFETKH